MPLTMSKQSRRELLNQARHIYASKLTRQARHDYLLEIQQLTGYKSLKTIIRHLSGKKKTSGKEKRGRKASLAAREINILKKLWLAMDQPCGKRLKAMLPEWIGCWEEQNHAIDPESRIKLLEVSSATLDRVLSPYKVSTPSREKDLSWSSLKALIPIVDYRRTIKEPGYLYADTVAHCGTTTKGSFVWTLTLTDDYTQWTSNRAIWNKGQHETCRALGRLINQHPFPLRGINTDNGSEFINYHLQTYLKERYGKSLITRSRPMMKNDNARAEEKNRHKVRDLIGYNRLADPVYVKLLNQIYHVNNLLNNHFYACSRIISKSRQQGKLKRKVDQARTPYARVMECLKAGRKRDKLELQHKSLNPLKLRNQLEEHLRTLFEMERKLEEKEERVASPLPLR